MMTDTIDPETGEVTNTRAVPRIRTLDGLVARANGGEYKDTMPDIITKAFITLYQHAREYDRIAKGKLDVGFLIEVDRYGEANFGINPKLTLPDPPLLKGLGRAFIDQNGDLVTSPQYDAPLLRDVGKRGGKLRE